MECKNSSDLKNWPPHIPPGENFSVDNETELIERYETLYIKSLQFYNQIIRVSCLSSYLHKLPYFPKKLCYYFTVGDFRDKCKIHNVSDLNVHQLLSYDNSICGVELIKPVSDYLDRI